MKLLAATELPFTRNMDLNTDSKKTRKEVATMFLHRELYIDFLLTNISKGS